MIAVISLSYGFRTWARSIEMKDEISIFKSAIKANPTSALMRNDLGISYTQYGEPQEAIKSFQEALELKEDPVTYFAMAEVYANLGQNNEADKFLQKAIKLDPEFADAYYNLASLYAFRKNNDKAKVYLNKALFLYEKQGKTENAKRYKVVFDDYFGSLDSEE